MSLWFYRDFGHSDRENTAVAVAPSVPWELCPWFRQKTLGMSPWEFLVPGHFLSIPLLSTFCEVNSSLLPPVTAVIMISAYVCGGWVVNRLWLSEIRI